MPSHGYPVVFGGGGVGQISWGPNPRHSCTRRTAIAAPGRQITGLRRKWGGGGVRERGGEQERHRECVGWELSCVRMSYFQRHSLLLVRVLFAIKCRAAKSTECWGGRGR